MTRFALTIFLSAFLLFQVQPILGKTIVPAFGGGAGVWTACMVFFQIMLLGGYAYAHWMSARLPVKRQSAVHLALLAFSMWSVYVTAPTAAWQPDDTSLPTARILMVLLGHVGLPYFMLSATGPLLQSWFAVSSPGRSPYRLYALSNVGSLLALLSYPFVVETQLALATQWLAWSIAYFAFALACGAVATPLLRARFVAAGDGEVTPARPESPRPTLARAGLWTALAAMGSVMLIATTNAQSQDVAATPLLWVVPLAVYLLTFIICFDRDRWYDRRVFVPMLAAGSITIAGLKLSDWSIAVQVATYTTTLFAACMVCHGELARSRPASEHLTAFYLTVALGGALGGLFVAVVAPAVFSDYWEYPFGLLVVLALAFWRLRGEHLWVARLRIAGFVGVAALASSTVYQIVRDSEGLLDSRRSFYGVLTVRRAMDSVGRISTLLAHGEIKHGTQSFKSAERRWPTSYYGRESGLGVAIHALRNLGSTGERPLRIGAIGLGTGTIAALTGPHDYLRFYEINADVEELARKHFTFLSDSESKIDVVIGDARVMLERERERGDLQGFDLLVIDAFNSDSVPIHLLTKEALGTYESHLNAATGVLAFHLSSRHLDLERVVRGISEAAGFKTRLVISPGELMRAATVSARWALVSRSDTFLADPRLQLAAELEQTGDPVVWTDGFSSILGVLGSPGAKPRRWSLAPNLGRFVLDPGQVLDPREEEDMLWRARQLYVDSGGRHPLMVVTVGSLPPGTMDQFVDKLFAGMGVDNGESQAALVVIERNPTDIMVRARLGSGWDEKVKLAAKDRLRREIAGALENGSSLSQSVAIGVRVLEGMIRAAVDLPIGG